MLLLTAFPVPGLDMDARVVLSGSMEPAIPTGSVIFTLPAEDYEVGDIITYRIEERETPTTHRIVEVSEDNGRSFITKGDANSANDPGSVNKEDILGSVRLHIPFLGFVINFARQPLGFFLFVIIPAIVISVDEVRKIVTEIKKEKTGNDKNKSLKERIKKTETGKTDTTPDTNPPARERKPEFGRVTDIKSKRGSSLIHKKKKIDIIK